MDCINKDERTMRIVYGDVTFGIHGNGFDYIFSYQTGGLESLVKYGKEWLYVTPRSTFWRATTDNDRGNGFPLKSGMWMGADLFQKCIHICVCVDETKISNFTAPANNCYSNEEYAKKVEITFTYETITIPATTVDVKYTVTADGKIGMHVHYHGKKGLPELPVFGIRFIMPTKAEGYRYKGLSGETYPDRMAGGIPGIYEIDGMPVTPYLVPQECGMHMKTEWVKVARRTVLDNSQKNVENTELTFRACEKLFGFSCLPYTAEELENATHQEELPAKRRTVLCICGAVRGVGGIDSWGSDVEESVRIDAEKDISFAFEIE